MSADDVTQDRKFTGVWFPAEVWLDENLGAIEKIILLEINSLDGDDGCFATNEYLARFCKCSEATVSRSIRKLKDLGYVREAKFDGRKRILRSCMKVVTRQPSQIDEADSSNCQGSLVNLTAPYICKSTNESTSRDKDKKATSSPASSSSIPYDAIVSHLNERTGKSYRASTKSTRAYIRAIIGQGFSVDDVMEVIDRKSRQWSGDPKMDKYLRPKTLFAPSNFEGYLNEDDGVARRVDTGRGSGKDERTARLEAKYGRL